jgi:transposase
LVDTSQTEEDVHMARKKKRKYTKEFRDEAIRLASAGDKPLTRISRELGVGHQTLWSWVHQAEVDAGKGDPEALTTTEREELRVLRKEVGRLREEREILKKATAFFAKESK